MSESTSRRLPVYLVLDCSGSMAGEPIEACRQGVKALLAELQRKQWREMLGKPFALHERD